MVDINLLPEELRKKEEKEKQAAEKKPKIFEVKMAAPKVNGTKGQKETDKTFTPIPKKEEFPVIHRQPFREEIYKEAARLAEEKSKEVKLPKTFVPPGGERVESKDIYVSPKPKDEAPKPRVFPKREALEKKQPSVPREKAVPRLSADIYQFGEPKVRRSFWDIVKGFFSIFSFRRKEKKPPVPKPAGEVKLQGTLGALQKPPPPIKKISPVTPPPAPRPSAEKLPPVPEIKLPKIQFPEKFGAPTLQPKLSIETAEKKERAPAKSAPLPPKPPKAEEKPPKKEKPFREIGINLIPEDILRKVSGEAVGKKFIALILSFIASGLLIGLIYGGLRFYEQRIGTEIQEIDESLLEKKQKIAEYERNRIEAYELQSKLELLERLLSNHVYWTLVFEELEKYTVEDVYFTSFSASREGGLNLSAIGRDYSSAARQLVTFQEAKDFIVFVEIRSATARSEKIKNKVEIKESFFNVALKMDPKIFFRKIEK